MVRRALDPSNKTVTIAPRSEEGPHDPHSTFAVTNPPAGRVHRRVPMFRVRSGVAAGVDALGQSGEGTGLVHAERARPTLPRLPSRLMQSRCSPGAAGS